MSTNVPTLTARQRQAILRGTMMPHMPTPIDWLHQDNSSDEYLQAFAAKLRAAKMEHDAGRHPGDVGVVAPRGGSGHGLKKQVVEKLAALLFPELASPEPRENYLCSIDQMRAYSRLIVDLSKAFHECEKQRLADLRAQLIKDNEFRVARASGAHRDGAFCTLRKRGVSDLVTHPTAMPVEVPPTDDEFHGLFNFLSSGGKVVGAADAYVQFTRGAVYGDGRIDCCKQVLGPNHIRKLMNSIAGNSFIRHFLLGNNIINTEGANAVADFLRDPSRKARINTWYIAGNALNAEGIATIADALVGDTDIRQLWLKRNPLTTKGVTHLANVLLSRPDCPLEVLDLTNTAIGDDGVKVLCEALKTNKNLRYLYLDANGLTDQSAVHLADYFRTLVVDQDNRVGVTSLWIGINRLGDSGIGTLMEGLREYKHLERLTVGSNRFTDVGMDSIADAITGGIHKKLTVINVGFYKSTADLGELPNHFNRVDHMMRILSSVSSLRVFIANECGLTEAHLEEIASHVDKFKHELRDINLSQSGVSLAPLDKVSSFLDANCRAGENCSLAEYRARHKRFETGGPDINLIDSIYRNNMK
jgi:hypothetical protein